MDLQAKIKETKARKKAFLKEMPEEQRRLLKLYARAKRAARYALSCIPVWFLILAGAYLLFCLLLPYQNHWVWNGVVAGALFVIVSVLLLLLRSSYRKKADAYASSIPDFVKEYDRLDDRIREMKQAERDRVRAEQKAQSAKEKAAIATERAAEKVRAAEERAVSTQQKAQAAGDAAAKIGSDEP